MPNTTGVDTFAVSRAYCSLSQCFDRVCLGCLLVVFILSVHIPCSRCLAPRSPNADDEVA